MILVPLAFIDPDYAVSEAVISYVEVPKIALLRTLAGLMTALLVIEWALQGQSSHRSTFKRHWTISSLSEAKTNLSRWLRESPARWLVLAVWIYLGTTFLSTVLSGSVKTSVWGEIPGQDGYNAYTVSSYLVIFSVVATHLKTRAQLWRLLGSVVAMGTLVAAYAVLQHYSHDFLNLTEFTGGGQKRVTSFMGNTIFAAAVMSMTIPISLGAAAASLREPQWPSRRFRTNLRAWVRSFTVMGLWSLVLATQLLGITFTFSRGPWVGTLASVVCFFGLGVIFLGWRVCGRLILMLGLTAVMAVSFLQGTGSISIIGQGPWFGLVIALAGVLGVGAILTNWRSLGWVGIVAGITMALAVSIFLAPGWLRGDGDATGSDTNPVTSNASGTISEVSGRFTSINPEVRGGSIGGRWTHWRISWQLMRERPWFEFDSLSLHRLRPFIGYGPDLFRYTYLLKSPPEGDNFSPVEPDHAHNYFIHQGVEQGFAGILSSLGIFAAVFLVSGNQLLRRRNDLSRLHKVVLIVLAATMMGRFLEMMVGVARVSDLTVLWILLGIFAALPTVMQSSPRDLESSSPNPRQSNRRRNPSHRSPDPTVRAYDLRFFSQMALVIWLLLGISIVTWTKGVGYVRAAVAESTAVRQFKDGDWQASLASLDLAIELAPDVPSYYNNRAQVFLAYQFNQNVPAEKSCTAQEKIPYHVCLAANGYQSNLDGAKQRPFYYRSQTALGDSAFNLGLVDRAVKSFRSSVALVPGGWLEKNNLAAAYLEGEWYQEALDILEKSLAITEESGFSADAYFLQGQAYRNLRDQANATQSLIRSLELGLSGLQASQAHRDLGKLHITVGDYDAAIARLDKSIDINSSDSSAYSLRGVAYSESGEHERAIEDFERALQIDPYQQLDNLRFGASYFRLGQNEKAIKALDDALRLDPGDGSALAYRGSAYVEMGQYELGFRDLDGAVRISPLDAEVYYLRGSAHFSLNQAADALKDLDIAIRLDPEVPNQYVVRGDIHNALGQLSLGGSDYATSVLLRKPAVPVDPESLISDLSEAIRLNSLEPQTYKTRGLAYHRLGRYDEAIADFDKSISFHTGHPIDGAQALIDRGMAYIGLGQHETALESFNTAIDALKGHLQSEDPIYFLYFFNRALANYNMGQYEKVIKDLDRAIEHFDHPDRPEGFVLRGIAYGQLGQTDLARRDLEAFERNIPNLERGLLLNPEYPKVYFMRGLAFLHMGQHLRSISYFNEAIDRDPQDPLFYLGRSAARARIELPQLSGQDLNQAIKLIEELGSSTGKNRVSVEALILQGQIYLDFGFDAQAALLFDTINGLDLTPQNHNMRGLIYHKFGQYEKAIADFSQSIDLHVLPIDSSSAYRDRGRSYTALGRYYQASEDFSLAIDRVKGHLQSGDPEYFTYFFGRAVAKFNLGHYEEVIKDLDRAIALFDHPDLPEAFVLRGITYGQMGQTDLARRDLKAYERNIPNLELGLLLNPEYPKVYFIQGLAFLHMGRYEQAISYFDEAIRIDPDDSVFHEGRRLAIDKLAQAPQN